MNPSIIANLRGISSSASLSLLLGFQNPQINYSNLHVRKFLDPLSSQPWTPRKTHIVDACKEINKFVSVNHAELNYKESVLEDLINFLEDLLRRLKQRKAFVLWFLLNIFHEYSTYKQNKLTIYHNSQWLSKLDWLCSISFLLNIINW